MRNLLIMMMMCGLMLSIAQGGEDGEKRGGTLIGVVVKKDPKSITVRGDEAGEPMKFIPEWHGGMPKDGGGLDKEMLAKLKTVHTGNRVKVTWHFEEHSRVTAIEILPPTGGKGSITGEVVKVDKRVLQIRSEGKLYQFMPVWSGGMPKDGGGLDKAMMERLREVKVGETLKVEWTYDERPRVIDFERVK